MKDIKPHKYDEESWDDETEPTTFQPLHKQTGKATTLKDDRRQKGKEWGRALHKHHKQRERTGKP